LIRFDSFFLLISFSGHLLSYSLTIPLRKSKVHHAVITEVTLGYVGSFTLDEDLVDAAGMTEHEKIHVVNCNNGGRIETYLIKGKRGSGVCCLNGPAARKREVGDVIIVISYAPMTVSEAQNHKPTIVFPKKITSYKNDY
jgi:aspartate 1-decarboxylase